MNLGRNDPFGWVGGEENKERSREETTSCEGEYIEFGGWKLRETKFLLIIEKKLARRRFRGQKVAETDEEILNSRKISFSAQKHAENAALDSNNNISNSKF